jgi:hypothetical protein
VLFFSFWLDKEEKEGLLDFDDERKCFCSLYGGCLEP